MACMTHVCYDCGYETFDNKRGGSCPKCHGDMQHIWDEENTYRDEYEEDRAERNRIMRDMDPE